MFKLKALFLPIMILGAVQTRTFTADFELSPGGVVRVGLGATGSQRVAVDVSSNLVNWKPMTNVAPQAAQVTFVNDPLQSDPARFFRLADGDDTFSIAGCVDFGPYFGGLAGVTVSESFSGTTAVTDASGFFHFDQRFARTNLPIRLTAVADGFGPAERVISSADAGTFSILQGQMFGTIFNLGFQTDANHAINFKVTGGPRAGLEFTIRFHNGFASVTGGVTGEGIFRPTDIPGPFGYIITLRPASIGEDRIFLYPANNNGAGGSGYFSGIPTTNGILAGSGTMTWAADVPQSVAPPSLDGLAFSLGGDARIQFTNTSYTLLWNGTNRNGSFSPTVKDNEWTVALTTGDPIQTTATLEFSFTTATNGLYKLQWPGQTLVWGPMSETAYLPQPPDNTVTPPTSLSAIDITTTSSGVGVGVDYTVTLAGGATGVFTTRNNGDGRSMGSGTYTYNIIGTEGRLRLDYSGPFTGDFDDMTLTFQATAGSASPSSFAGTQRIGGNMLPFFGAFTY